MPNSQSESRCKPCQLENNRGLCDRSDCSNHKSPQEGWIERFDNEFPSPDGHDFMDNERISSVKNFIRTTIASELELYKKGLAEKIENERTITVQDEWVKLETVLAIIKASDPAAFSEKQSL